MKQRFLLLTIALFFCGVLGLNAQLLWKVSGNGAKGSYLFGTHHLAHISLLDSIKDLQTALKNSDVLYGEVDMEFMQSPEIMGTMMQRMMAPSDSTLSKVLTPQQLDSVSKAINHYSPAPIDIFTLEGMKPSAVMQQIVLLQSMKCFPDFNLTQQLDATMQKRAKLLGIPVKGFETAEFQLNLLFGKPIKEQVNSLMETIRDIQKQEKMAKELADAYMSQDIKKIDELINSERDDDKSNMRPILEDRNYRWLETIKERLPHEKMLIVVGVGHLVDSEGLIELLRESGYSVTPCE